MSMYGTFTPNYDEDEYAGAMRVPNELGQRAMLSSIIHAASKINEELLGRVPGMLLEYATYARDEAAGAAAELLIAHPSDSARIFELQKKVAAYAHVMGWVKDKFSEANGAEIDLAEINEEVE